ncbi:MAG TPA: ATP-dependent DNA helicase [Candidatus Limnocylindrales bacterium]|nr:ATP-dependent DNA helicase [Candidatus Limnocylindrales bacterium]
MAIEIALPEVRPSRTGARAPISLEVVAGLLAGLNREQRRAVTHGDGPQLVIAGPGTGKTQVVTHRLAWLIATGRARPSEILALTFTDNAASEMQERVDVLLPYGMADAHIHTFHAFGDRVLREHAFELGMAGDVRLINRAEAVVLLRDHLFELGLDRYRPLGDPTRFLEALADLFSRAKDEGVDPAMLATHVSRLAATAPKDDAVLDTVAARSEIASAYGKYQSLLASNRLIDHGDQVALPLRLMNIRPAVRRELVGRYRYLLVDEFQDMNRAQIELVMALTNEPRNVTVVGDPDQAIYTFRGAATDGIARFAAAHSDLRTVTLRTNYRSHRPIIRAAQRLISHARPSSWRPADNHVTAAHKSSKPEPVHVVSYATPDEEADGVADEIVRRIRGGDRPRDLAVLTRSNVELGPIVRGLTLRGVPVRSHSRSDFYAQPAVRPLLAFLRAVTDPSNTVELYVLASSSPYGLGGADLTALMAASRRRNRPFWEVLRESVDHPTAGTSDAFSSSALRLVSDVRAAMDLSHERTAAEVLYDHLRRSGRLAKLAGEIDPADANAVARFFDIVRSREALIVDPRVPSLVPHLDALIEAEDEQADTGPLDADAVSVLTVHRAKGLEFRVVYVVGLSDGRFPARGRPAGLTLPWGEIRGDLDDQTEEQLDEERRLCFVAMTRARDELWLSHHSSGRGGRGSRRASQFIAEALDVVPQSSAAPANPMERIEIAAPSPTPPASPAEPAKRSPSAKPTFSFSQLEDYLECPERYRLRHVVGVPSPPHHALSYGRAMHEAVAYFHLEAGRGQAPSEEELLGAFDRAWRSEGFLSREHEDARYKAGRIALLSFRTAQLADPARVVAVERPFEFDLDGVRIRGRMDRVDDGPNGKVIVDYKSSNVTEQRKADEKARNSLQLQVYAMAQEATSGELPTELQLHFLDSGVVGRTQPSADRLERTRTKIGAALEGIAGEAFPAKPNAIACGYCPFRQICASSAA